VRSYRSLFTFSSSTTEVGGEENGLPPTAECETDATTHHTHVYMLRGSERNEFYVAQKLVPNYSDFLINVSADDDGACESSFLSLFFPLPHTYT